MLMADRICHMGSTKSCKNKSFIINSCQEIHLYAIGAKTKCTHMTVISVTFNDYIQTTNHLEVYGQG